MEPKRKRGRPQAVTPEEILERAVALFCAEGVDALSLNNLCARLGISKPALYRSFGSEDGLRQAALVHYFETWMAPGMGNLDFAQPFAKQCEQLASMICHPDPKSPQAEGCLYSKMRLSRSVLGSKSLAMVEELEAGSKDRLTEWMKAISKSGQLRKGITAVAAAAYLDGQIMLATIQRSQGVAPATVKKRLLLALSALRP